MGLARPLRVMNTPVMNVVLTAPRPTTMTPSLPVAGFVVEFTIIILSINVLFSLCQILLCTSRQKEMRVKGTAFFWNRMLKIVSQLLKFQKLFTK
jgi:hypothetical protein